MSGPVLAERTANALIVDAVGNIPNFLPAAFVLGLFKRAYGGLWVGGKARLTQDSLSFAPNAMNRAFHSDGQLDVSIPLTDITSISVERGFVTRIIVVAVGPSALKIRCYKADVFADQLREAAGHH